MKHLFQNRNGSVMSAQPQPPDNRSDQATEGAEGVLFALALAVEQRDNVTSGHCERLAVTGLALGMSLSLDRPSLLGLYRGGYLHDVGKVGIPDAILLKPGKLTPQEWEIMRSHPTRGVEICQHLDSLAPVLPIIRHHHERWDGSGYPDGLKGEEIPLLARILQIVDIYDALTNARSYKSAFTPKAALRIMEEETARGWRDPVLMERFFSLHNDVILKVVEQSRRADRSLAALGKSLTNVDHMIQPLARVAGLDLPA